VRRIEGIVWLPAVVDKLARKHHVSTEEVDEMFENRPRFRFLEKGRRQGEDAYVAFGRTAAGRYLSVLFIYKRSKEALVLSARDMATKEKRRYEKK
jgi:uncharacterized DUF497 family protein